MAVPKRKMSRSNTRSRRSQLEGHRPDPLVSCNRVPRAQARRTGVPRPAARTTAATSSTSDVGERAAAAKGDDRPATAARSSSASPIDPELLERALTHRSYAYENGGLPTNERLEFLGDSVLGAGRHRHAVPHPPRPARGAAGQAARRRRQHARAGRGRPRPRPRATTSGSAAARRPPAAATSPRSWPTPSRRVIGAVYLDRGLEAAAGLVHRLFDPLIDAGRRRSAPASTGRPACRSSPPTRGLGVPGVRRQRDRPGPREDLHRRRPGRRRAVRRAAPAAARRRPSRRPRPPPGAHLRARAAGRRRQPTAGQA